MARRTSRPARPARTSRTADSPCPCGLAASYGVCCGRFHSGQATAPTAELLMRSRYSAFVVRDGAYLLRTWHPGTRPASVEFDREMRWSGLEILETADGSVFHDTGTVTFAAHYTHGDAPGALRERSRFERCGGGWVYVNGTFEDSAV
ncbi:YchJ family metal-binding protein [Streptomyces sp. SCSIO 30461]|uniref:YchJ family protein n=1 Tax=Streptomyces sp. SCSIO 30461 TaxID=3118085 RepID=UPI0030CFCBDF